MTATKICARYGIREHGVCRRKEIASEINGVLERNLEPLKEGTLTPRGL
jgi:hypothetical protein